MSDNTTKTMEDLEFNELLFVSRSSGKLQSWGGWKRAIDAFHDPAMWEDPANWAKYFEPLQGNAWGPVGKGVVLVDFDTHQVLSLNDWSTPDSLMPRNPRTVWEDGPDPTLAPLLALGSRPDQWDKVQIELTPMGLFLPEGKKKTVTMEQLLPAGASAEDFLKVLTLTRDGMLDLGAHGRGHGWCRYLPDGWVQHDDRGQEMPEWLIERLEALAGDGWPAPYWASFDSQMASSELPLEMAQIEQMIEEDGDDEWVRDMAQLGKRYLALKQAWGQPVVAQAASPKP